MDIATCLTLVDLLCAREFPADHSGYDGGAEGPGYFTVELMAGQDLAAGYPELRERTAADFHAHREALAERIGDRWGRQPPWGQLTVRVRMGRGEEIPEPWAGLGLRTDVLDVWRAEPAGRWVALGVADRDPADDIRLLLAVTEIPPP
ncbi:hypothetical protein [Streptomyces sp. NPDC046759]|uniref:hypothetical protein n=1 Tax=Streptomyces sp. NPDC046759 TaxID=3155019 RepID=UPI0033E69D61